MKRIIVIFVCIIFAFTGVLYAETKTKETDAERQKREQLEATNSYLGDNTTPRAKWRVEGEDEWRDVNELFERDRMRMLKQKEIIDFQLDKYKRKINI